MLKIESRFLSSCNDNNTTATEKTDEKPSSEKKEPLFTMRKPIIEEEERVPCEDDLLIDDLECEDFE